MIWSLCAGGFADRSAGSGAPFERTYWGLFRVRDERVVWWHAFQNEAEALEAASLAQ